MEKSISLLHDDNQGPMLTEAESFSTCGFQGRLGCHCSPVHGGGRWGWFMGNVLVRGWQEIEGTLKPGNLRKDLFNKETILKAWARAGKLSKDFHNLEVVDSRSCYHPRFEETKLWLVELGERHNWVGGMPEWSVGIRKQPTQSNPTVGSQGKKYPTSFFSFPPVSCRYLPWT